MARPTVLEITKHENDYRFRLTRAGQPFMTTKKVWSVRPDPGVVEALNRRIELAVTAAGQGADQPGLNLTPFKDAGRSLYREMLGGGEGGLEHLRDALRRLRASLVISTDDPGIPWELLFDEDQDQFFGLRYNLGRQLHAVSVTDNRAKCSETWRCLFIGNPNPDEPEYALPSTGQALRQLRDSLHHRGVKDIHFLEEEHATFDAVLELLDRHEYDVIHYAGHTMAQKKPGAKVHEFALRLHRGIPFSASAIRKHVRGTPVVFLNGCWTGLARGVASQPHIVEGLTDAFLQAGAQMVLGSQFEAPAAGARAFADKFYEAALTGKPVGEAVRRAREHVMKKTEYGAAWACFVMYGDPCLQLKFNPQEDLLDKLLASSELRRSDFENPCLRVIEQALDYSGQSEVVATLELFAALVDSESSWLRDRLEEQDVPVEKLRLGFQSAAKKINARSRPKKKLDPEFSVNTKAIVAGARELAREEGRGRVTERDIIKSFVRKKGGSIGKILVELDVDLQKLNPDLKPPRREKAGAGNTVVEANLKSTVSITNQPLGAHQFTPEAWMALQHAMEATRHLKTQVLGTPQLFYGLLQNSQGPLAKALLRLSAKVKFERSDFGLNGYNGPPALPRMDLQLSASVQAILDGAHTIAITAGRTLVSEADLLVSFVRLGGGSIGKKLRSLGVPIEALASESFLADGHLDISRFAPFVRILLSAAGELAGSSGHGMIGRSHLLYAMLAREKSLLAGLMVEAGQQPKVLLERFLLKFQGHITSALTPAPAGVSNGLAQVICLAEAEARKRQDPEINEPVLLLFLLQQSQEICGQLALEPTVWLELIRKLRSQT